MADFAAFSKTFKGDLVTPADPGYQTAIARWARNAVRLAKVVAFVKDAEDVSAALKYARDAGLNVAIRGGGHHAAAASSVEDGLVVDLSKYLNKVTVDADKKLAYVEGGALWKTVDEEGMKHGLATVGGTVNHTGVGGLTLGGGYGYLSGRHGLVIDNLESVTIVVADGRILKASLTENADLFWGIRGSGSNFGVVTEFVLRLHPHPRNVFCGPVVFSTDKLEAIAKVLDVWWPQAKPDEAIFLAFTRGGDGIPVIKMNLAYQGPEKEARQIFKPIFDIGPIQDNGKERPYEELNGLFNGLAIHGSNYYMKGIILSEKPSDDVSRKRLDSYIELCSVDPSLHSTVLYEWVPQAKVKSVPADAMAFRRVTAGNGAILVKWDEEAPNRLNTAKDVAHGLAALAPKGWAYGNYSEGGLNMAKEDKSEGFADGAYPRLRELKKKYDPDLVFNRWYPILPAA